MEYLRVPSDITLSELHAKSTSWSAGMYRGVIIPTCNVKHIRDLLVKDNPFDKGVEPGSLWYIRKSSRYFIRTKALQEHSCLLYRKGDAIVPINPKVFQFVGLSDGDILMSKDSNVGECVMIDSDRWKDYMFCGGIVRLHPTCDRHYLFAFLKHPLFKTQLRAMLPRGSTITHAKKLWLDCVIPFPNQLDIDTVIRYVAALSRAIVDKEKEIRDRTDMIHCAIHNELISNQRPSAFVFKYPSIHDVRKLGRLDAGIYDMEYKSKIWLVDNYINSSETPSENGFKVTPGPSLEIKILRTRLDSPTYKPGFYALILPTNISVYGTMNEIPYMGTGKKLPLLQKGDIVFGEAGFQKGRSVVLLEGIDKCTTNAHGLYARRQDGDIVKSIFFRCIFNWYRSMRLVDIMAVGGSGGHFSPEYFDYVRIPKFPDEVQANIARLYHNPVSPPSGVPTLSTFVEWHRSWNTELGIWELDLEMKKLQEKLLAVQEQIIQGNTVSVPLT